MLSSKGKKLNLDRLNKLISTTGELIASDPLHKSLEDVDDVSSELQGIQEGLEGKKRTIVEIISGWIGKDEGFRFKSFEGKIQSVFSKFDRSKAAIDSSIRIFERYSEKLLVEIGSIESFVSGVELEGLDVDSEMEYKTVVLILDNLRLSYARILSRLDSSRKISRQMELSRPAFQTLLSSAIVESSNQMVTQGCMDIVKSMGGALDRMSNQLTESAIQTAQLAFDAETKPLLGAGAIKENVERLKSELESISHERKRILLESHSCFPVDN